MRHIIENLYLDTDSFNYILKKRLLRTTGNNIGQEYFEILGYYGRNLKLLLNGIVDIYCLEEINNIEFKQMIGYINKILKLKEELIK